MDKRPQNISSPRSGQIAPGSFEELANQQGVTPIDDFEMLLGKPSPEDESAEEFSEMLHQWRREITDANRSRASAVPFLVIVGKSLTFDQLTGKHRDARPNAN